MRLLNFNLRYLIAELKGRKNRSLLMIGGLALGIAMWLCLHTLAVAYEQASSVPLRQLGADLTIQKSKGPIPNKFEGAILPCANAVMKGQAVEQVKTIPGVEGMTRGLLLWVFDAGMKNANDFKMVLGIDPSSDLGPGKLKSEVKIGRFLSPGDRAKAVLDENYASTKGLKPGDTIKITDHAFEVVGIVKTPSASLLGATNIYIPLTNAQEIAGHAAQIKDFQDGDVNLLFVKADPTQLAAIQTAVTKILPGVTVSTPTSFLASMGGMAKAAKRLAWVGTLIAMIAALAMAIRTNASAVYERRRDIAVMKAVGWTATDVRRQVMAENLLLGLIGGTIGLAAYFLFTLALQGQVITIPLPWELDPYPHFYLNNNAEKFLKVPLTINLSWSLAFIALVSGVLIAFLTAIFITGRLVRIKPSEVLRNE